MEEEVVSKGTAVAACTAMTLSYVAILYAPTLILRLPPPPSFNSFMIRRFVCAAISSIVSLLICALILPIRRKEASVLLGVYGIQVDPIWQAVVFPVFLTSLMYAGSLVLKSLVLVESWRDNVNHGEGVSLECIKIIVQKLIASIVSVTSNVLAWRNFVVAPLTEELVFRACMIPLLLCGGFKPYTVIYLCPIFFSLGHLIAPLAAHMFCNFMGLPVLFSRRNGMVSIAFVAGMVGFLSLLFPMTRPDLYNYRSNNCKCWHGYCSWS
ncbi:CAAX prenyl protease 2 isoform X2 [Juglans microcarpa x Juglans regia]|uniref:CAAX prenyl protease 2 isoform X2 n=1 Tax=Juglans microcarpa x Juglans regia TaxID=2249226 RepID=UPI001B7F2046|nr:CAAX prenyl protease 2 isoform X2 [Juglans microcarpa x Juglans regia]